MTDHEIMLEVGRRLRRRRRARGLTLSEFGKLVGYGHQQISRFETGETRITVAQFVRFTAALEVSPASILSGIDGGMA